MRKSFKPKDDWSKSTRNKLLCKENKQESYIDKVLKSIGVIYQRERPIVVDSKKYFIDFLVTSVIRNGVKDKVRVAIEVDGEYHFSKEQEQKDQEKNLALLSSSRVNSVIRISTKNASSMNAESLLVAILSAKAKAVTYYYD
jgi:very-short-patch-repair endonuclease